MGFDNYHLSQLQSVFKAQKETLNYLAEKSDCVIIGRCADYILKDLNPYRIFVYADIESRLARCKQRSPDTENYTDSQLKKHILRIDKDRAKYYNYCTGNDWGDRENYDLLINTTNVVIKDIVPSIAKIFS